MLQAFKAHIASFFPALPGKRLLLACSGGVDSTVLVHLCAALEFDFAIAHCNFGLRGGDSDADEAFVADLAGSLGCRFFARRFDTAAYVSSHNASVQMAARELRYEWFSDLMKQEGLDLLLTAHQADDQLETFLINLSRGTGLEGLRGIPPKGPGLARPLLPFTRSEILEYARSNNLKWREDRSNAESKYLRNKIRHHIAPGLQELHPTFRHNFLKTLGHLSGSSALIANYKGWLKQELFLRHEGHIRIPTTALSKLEPQTDCLHLLFSEYGFTDLNALKDMLHAPSGKVLFGGLYRLIKDRDYLLLQELPGTARMSYDFETGTAEISEPLNISVEEVGAMGEQSADILYVDKETLNPVLTLRKWQKGDYFYPLGMKGRKLVAKFFKDEKMDMIAKENQWLLCSGDDVVWIVGRRGDERFRIRPETSRILKITRIP